MFPGMIRKVSHVLTLDTGGGDLLAIEDNFLSGYIKLRNIMLQ
jgi:hypothetical protein